MSSEMPIAYWACVECGARLKTKNDIDVFACACCGLSQRVERWRGAIALAAHGRN